MLDCSWRTPPPLIYKCDRFPRSSSLDKGIESELKQKINRHSQGRWVDFQSIHLYTKGAAEHSSRTGALPDESICSGAVSVNSLPHAAQKSPFTLSLLSLPAGCDGAVLSGTVVKPLQGLMAYIAGTKGQSGAEARKSKRRLTKYWNSRSMQIVLHFQANSQGIFHPISARKQFLISRCCTQPPVLWRLSKSFAYFWNFHFFAFFSEAQNMDLANC